MNLRFVEVSLAAIAAVLHAGLFALIYEYGINYRIPAWRAFRRCRSKLLGSTQVSNQQTVRGILRALREMKGEYPIVVTGDDPGTVEVVFQQLQARLAAKRYLPVRLSSLPRRGWASLEDLVIDALSQEALWSASTLELEALTRRRLRSKKIVFLYDPPSVHAEERLESELIAIESLVAQLVEVGLKSVFALPIGMELPSTRALAYVIKPDEDSSHSVKEPEPELGGHRPSAGDGPNSVPTPIVDRGRIRRSLQQVDPALLRRVSIHNESGAIEEFWTEMLMAMARLVVLRPSWYVSDIDLTSELISDDIEAPFALIQAALDLAVAERLLARLQKPTGTYYSFVDADTYREALALDVFSHHQRGEEGRYFSQLAGETSIAAHVSNVVHLGKATSEGGLCVGAAVTRYVEWLEKACSPTVRIRIHAQLLSLGIDSTLILDHIDDVPERMLEIFEDLPGAERRVLCAYIARQDAGSFGPLMKSALGDELLVVRTEAAIRLASVLEGKEAILLEQIERLITRERAAEDVLDPSIGSLFVALPLAFRDAPLSDGKELMRRAESLLAKIRDLPGGLGVEASFAQGLKSSAVQRPLGAARDTAVMLAVEARFWFSRFLAHQALCADALHSGPSPECALPRKRDPHPLVERVRKLSSTAIESNWTIEEAVWVDETTVITRSESGLRTKVHLLLAEVVAYLNLAEYGDQDLRDLGATRNVLPLCIGAKSRLDHLASTRPCLQRCDFGFCDALGSKRNPQGLSEREGASLEFLLRCEEAGARQLPLRRWLAKDTTSVTTRTWQRLRRSDIFNRRTDETRA